MPSREQENKGAQAWLEAAIIYNVLTVVPLWQIKWNVYSWSQLICSILFKAFWRVIMLTNTPISTHNHCELHYGNFNCDFLCKPDTFAFTSRTHMWPRVAWPQTRPQPTHKRNTRTWTRDNNNQAGAWARQWLSRVTYGIFPSCECGFNKRKTRWA